MKIKRESIYNIMICMYVFSVIVMDDGSMLMKVARLLLAGTWGLKILFEKTIKLTPYVLRMVPFFLFAALSVTWAESTGYAMAMTKTLVFNIVCVCALVSLIDNKRERVDLSLKTMIFAPLFLEMRVIMMGGLLGYLDARFVGPISGNTVGMCAAFGACIALYYWMQGQKKYGILFTVNTMILILSASRKGLLCACIPIAILYIFDTKISLKKRALRCAALIAAGVIGLWLMMRIPLLYALVGNRVEGLFATLTGNVTEADSSSESRSLLITWGMEWFRERPLLGYGIDNYRIVLVKHHPDWPISYYAHNNYVELLVDTGIIGLALYYWNYVVILLNSWKNRKAISNKELLVLGMFISIIISEIALVSYYDRHVQVLLLVIWIMLSESEQTKNKIISLRSEDLRNCAHNLLSKK